MVTKSWGWENDPIANCFTLMSKWKLFFSLQKSAPRRLPNVNSFATATKKQKQRNGKETKSSTGGPAFSNTTAIVAHRLPVKELYGLLKEWFVESAAYVLIIY